MKSKHICPKCGGKKFTTVAHIAQDWVVDEYGNFQSIYEPCTEVTAEPDDDNIWVCTACGEEGIIIKG